jgi:tetratricopeptide (TPR) repeat protein
VLPLAAGLPEAQLSSPAVELLAERARAAGAELPPDADTARALAEICWRLDGLPLAIELAAARVRLLPPAALLARLDRRLPVLAGGPHDLPARQKTMRDAIAWSYELLNEPEQALFRRMCVFAGGCTLEAAEVVCAGDGEGPAVLDGVASLVASSLLRLREAPAVGEGAPSPSAEDGADSPSAGDSAAALSAVDGDLPPAEVDGDLPPAALRLTMLETIREYGTELLVERSESAEIGRRHAAYCLALAEQAGPALTGPGAVAWMARLDTEHDNLRAALRWAREQDDSAAVLRLAAALWPFWQQRGHLSEGRRWLRAGLDRLAAMVPPPVRVNGLVGAARLAMDQAAYDEAAERCVQAVALARELGNPRALAAALNTRGMLAQAQDRYADSARDHQVGLEQARAAADRAGEATALLGLASWATRLRRPMCSSCWERSGSTRATTSVRRVSSPTAWRCCESGVTRRPHPGAGSARRRGVAFRRHRQPDVPAVVPGGPGRGRGGPRRLRARCGARRGPRRPAYPDRCAAAARLPGRVHTDAGRRPRRPRAGRLRRGPRQVIPPGTAADHRGGPERRGTAAGRS